MTTTPVQSIAIAPHCTMTGCWANDVRELHDKTGRVIAHYCPEHRAAVVALRQSHPVTLCKVTAWEVLP